MKTIKNIIYAIAAIAVAAGLWTLEPVREQLIDWAIKIQAHGLLVLTIAAVIVALLVITISFFRSKNQSRDRDMYEIMRVAKQNAETASSALKVEPKSEPEEIVADPNGADLLLGIEELNALPKLRLINGGKDKQTKSEPAERPAMELSDELFFRPILRMPEGELAGYDVYRKNMSSGQIGGTFIQLAADLPEAEQAAFESSMIDLTLSTMRQAMDLEIGAVTGRRLHVMISSALIDDDECWTKIYSTLRAHQKAAEGLCLCVTSDAFSDKDIAIVKKRMAKITKLGVAGVDFNLAGISDQEIVLTNQQFDAFSAFSCDLKVMLGVDDTHDETFNQHRLAMLQRIKNNEMEIHGQNIITEADVVDGLTAGATFLSGDYFSVPRALKGSGSAPTKKQQNAAQ